MTQLTPIFFSDFDGVWNALPYEEVWVGPQDRGTLTDLDLMDQSNWEIREFSPDLSTHFELDRQKIVPHFARPGKFVRLQLSTEMIQQGQAWMAADAIKFVWLTFWREASQHILDPAMTFDGEKTSWLDWFPRRSDRYQLGKREALFRYLEAENVHPETPIIWIDDVATLLDVNHPQGAVNEYTQSVPHQEPNLLESHPRLVIKTNPLWGISRQEMDDINTFLKDHS